MVVSIAERNRQRAREGQNAHFAKYYRQFREEGFLGFSHVREGWRGPFRVRNGLHGPKVRLPLCRR
jgi:hypothetical protein